MFDFIQARREMVDCQIRTADVTNYEILKALSAVEREKFVPDEASTIAYGGTNIHLGKDRYLIEPRTFAKMLELLNVKSNDLILDIGKRSIENIESIINNSKTIFWNGPAGYFENQFFAEGSMAIAKKIALERKNIYSYF